MGEIVGAREFARDDHAPGIDDEIARLRRVQGREVGVDPVEAQLRRRRQPELVLAYKAGPEARAALEGWEDILEDLPELSSS
jgi:hypothetical protein